MRLVRRLVVGRVEIGDARLEARVHDREVLVGQCDVHHEIGLIALDERHETRHVHRVDLRRRDLGGDALLGEPGTGLNVLLDRDAARLGTRGNQQFAEHLGIATHLRGCDTRNTTCSNEHDLLSHDNHSFPRGTGLLTTTRIPYSTAEQFKGAQSIAKRPRTGNPKVARPHPASPGIPRATGRRGSCRPTGRGRVRGRRCGGGGARCGRRELR